MVVHQYSLICDVFTRHLAPPTPTVVSKIIGPPEFFPLDSIVNKSCNIEYCGNKMHQIVPNMMLYQYLQLKLNLL